MSGQLIDDIEAGIEIIGAVLSHLTAAKAAADQGGTLTDEQRAALGVANEARKSRLLAAIDARIGPDPEDAANGGPNVEPAPAALPEAAAALKAQADEIQRLTNELAAARQAGYGAAMGPDAGPAGEDPGPVEP